LNIGFDSEYQIHVRIHDQISESKNFDVSVLFVYQKQNWQKYQIKLIQADINHSYV